MPLLYSSANHFNQVTANRVLRHRIHDRLQPSQPAQPLRKVASGGAVVTNQLGIQVVNRAITSIIPTLVFDE